MWSASTTANIVRSTCGKGTGTVVEGRMLGSSRKVAATLLSIVLRSCYDRANSTIMLGTGHGRIQIANARYSLAGEILPHFVKRDVNGAAAPIAHGSWKGTYPAY